MQTAFNASSDVIDVLKGGQGKHELNMSMGQWTERDARAYGGERE
jgi:hypothetical protein